MTPPNTAHAEGPSPRPEAATLSFRDVVKVYDGSAEPVIDRLSFDVAAGEICVLVGPSGCGKTTAMRMVNRMVDITAGDILIGDRSVRDADPARLRREIGYVIQQVGLFPHHTVGENVAAVPRLLGWPKARIADRVDELLELVGLDPATHRDRYPAQLSGGQRQRVGVARALACDPPLMLMDEPFGAIDPINRERLQDEFLRLQAQLRKTVVFVTHDIDEAIKMGDRIAVMKAGGVLAQYATPAELLMRPADAFVEGFVGADRAIKRLSLLRVRDLELDAPDGAGPGAGTGVTVDADAVLRDALSALLQAGADRATVVDGHGTATGVLSVELVGRLLASGDTAAESAVERAGGQA